MRVAGVGQHMERKAAARRQSEEQRQREAKVFNEKPGTRTRPFTTPEPFKLATAKMEPRTQSRLEALAKEELRECTFQPCTQWESQPQSHAQRHAQRHARGERSTERADEAVRTGSGDRHPSRYVDLRLRRHNE